MVATADMSLVLLLALWSSAVYIMQMVSIPGIHSTCTYIYPPPPVCLAKPVMGKKKSQAANKSICTEYEKLILNAVQRRSTLYFKMETLPFREAGNTVHSTKRKTEN